MDCIQLRIHSHWQLLVIDLQKYTFYQQQEVNYCFYIVNYEYQCGKGFI